MDVNDLMKAGPQTPPMDVKTMIARTFGAPTGGNPLHPFAGVEPQPKIEKNDIFDPSLMAQAQNTFAGGQHAQGSPQGQNQQNQPGTNTPKKGTVGNMIPPGWSSQAAK